MNPAQSWKVGGLEQVASPALLVDEDRVRNNIRRMVEAVQGNPSRLRTHLKTHKMAEVLRLQMEAGICKFKAATLAELELAGRCGAAEALLASQPVGPNQERLERVRERYPDTEFAAICDDEGVLRQLSDRFRSRPLTVLIDVDCGMGRTGCRGDMVVQLHGLAGRLPGVRAGGLHVYDGHVHAAGADERRRECERALEALPELLLRCQPERVVGGGSPSFPFHAARALLGDRWECSPGTTVFWDAGYGERYPDLPYEPAAFLLTRVISKPGPDRLCLDLGHKSVAAENPLARRVRLLGLEDAEPLMHSEEHLVLRTAQAGEMALGTEILALPVHVCPTVALHEEAQVVRDGRVSGEVWKVAARARRLAGEGPEGGR